MNDNKGIWGYQAEHINMINWNSKDAILCCIGGLLIGTVAGCRMFIFGKVTGISGALSGLVEIKKENNFDRGWLNKLFFVVGLMVNFNHIVHY